MRTTVTLDPDTYALVRRLMRERDLTFKAALNEAIRAGVNGSRPARRYTHPRPMGAPLVDVTKALQLSAQLEDEVVVRKLAEGR